LPPTPYEYAEWKKARVNIDYHVEVDGHYYSVPYQLVRQQVEVRLTAHCVECFYKGQRVSSHRRSSLKGRHTNLTDHMPKTHQRYLDWTPERLVRWAQTTGPATAQLVVTILASRPHPQQGFRSCLGIMRLAKPTASSVWKQRATAPWRSTPARTKASSPSSSTALIATPWLLTGSAPQ
jgi:transposase